MSVFDCELLLRLHCVTTKKIFLLVSNSLLYKKKHSGICWNLWIVFTVHVISLHSLPLSFSLSCLLFHFFLVSADFLAPQVILLRSLNHLLIWSIMHPPLMLLLLSRKEAAPYLSSLGISPKLLISLVKSKYFSD